MLCGSGVHLFDGHHPDPEAILQDLIPTNDEDGPRGHDARNLLVVAIGRPLEQDNRPPASFGLGGLENQLGVLLELGAQLQVALRIGGILILPGCGGITRPGQMVLGHLLLRQRVRFGFVGLAKLHLHGLLLVHRLHQGPHRPST